MSAATLSPSDTHDRLLNRFTSLLDLLLEERAALIGTSADDLQALVSRKESLCADIARTQHALLDALKPETTLPDSMAELRRLAERCRQENAVNGRIASRARRSTRTLLAILTGDDDAELYAKDGSDQVPASGVSRPGHHLGSA